MSEKEHVTEAVEGPAESGEAASAPVQNGEISAPEAILQSSGQNSAEGKKAGGKKNKKPRKQHVEKEAPFESEVRNPDGSVTVHGKVLTKKQLRTRTAIRWILITFGTLLMGSSVYFFQVPNNFTLGGMAGISIILSSVITPLVPFLTQGVILAIINVILLIIGFIVLGKKCTVRTVYCSLLYTGMIMLLEIIVPLDKPLTAEYITDELGNILTEGGVALHTGGQPFLELCYAILLFGAGGAIIFNCGASSGGTDIIALILKKFTRLNVGVALMIVDLLIVAVSIFTFQNVTSVLYSLLGLFARTFLLDGIIEGMTKTKYLTIITTHQEEIGEYILNTVNHSYTTYDAEGGYTHEKKKVVVTVCKRGEALKIKAKVKAVDPSAFVIITDANEILGKGFGGTF